MPALKILNIFEILLLLLVSIGIKVHYDPHVSHSFFSTASSHDRIIIDIVLVYVILIRLKDLVLNFNPTVLSPKKYYRPLIIYTIAIVPDMYFYITFLLFAKHFFPMMAICLLPIIILIIRIIAIKKHLKATTYSEDILDRD
jgi:hypothetical protein